MYKYSCKVQIPQIWTELQYLGNCQSLSTTETIQMLGDIGLQEITRTSNWILNLTWREINRLRHIT